MPLCNSKEHRAYLTRNLETVNNGSVLGTSTTKRVELVTTRKKPQLVLREGLKPTSFSRFSLLYALWSLDRGDEKKRYPGCWVRIKLGSPAPPLFGHVVSGFLEKQ